MLMSHSQFLTQIYKNSNNHTHTQRFLFLVLSVPQSVMWDTWPRCPTVKHNIPVPTRASRTSVPPGHAALKEQGALGAGHFRALWAELAVVLCLLPSSARADHQHVKHIFRHISIWHTGLSCLGLSYFPDQSLLKRGNPISRPAS